MDGEQVVKYIRTLAAHNIAELNRINTACVEHIRQLERDAAKPLRVGDTVTFTVTEKRGKKATYNGDWRGLITKKYARILQVQATMQRNPSRTVRWTLSALSVRKVNPLQSHNADNRRAIALED
jgi:hypothetical protein